MGNKTVKKASGEDELLGPRIADHCVADRILAPFGPHAGEVAILAERHGGFRRALIELSQGQFHLLGFALSWRARHGDGHPSLEMVGSAVLIMKPRKLILDLTGTCPNGLPGCLSKLPAHLLRADAYFLLFHLLQEPKAARVLWHIERITPELLALLDHLDPVLRVQPFVTFLKTPKTVKAIEYLLAIVFRLDPAVDRVAVFESLTAVTSAPSLEGWFTRWLCHCPFPAPPWPGNECFRPLTSASDLFAAALAFRNCLKGRLPKVLGGCAYYYVRTEAPPVVVELVKHPLAGWVRGTIEGVGRAKIPGSLMRNIERQLQAAGFRSVPDFAALPDRLNPVTWTVSPFL